MASGGQKMTGRSRTKAADISSRKDTPPVKEQSDEVESYAVDDPDIFYYMKEMCMSDLQERATKLGVVMETIDEQGASVFYMTGAFNKINQMKKEIDALQAKLMKKELDIKDRDVDYLRSRDGKKLKEDVESEYGVYCDIDYANEGTKQLKDKESMTWTLPNGHTLVCMRNKAEQSGAEAVTDMFLTSQDVKDFKQQKKQDFRHFQFPVPHYNKTGSAEEKLAKNVIRFLTVLQKENITSVAFTIDTFKEWSCEQFTLSLLSGMLHLTDTKVKKLTVYLCTKGDAIFQEGCKVLSGKLQNGTHQSMPNTSIAVSGHGSYASASHGLIEVVKGSIAEFKKVDVLVCTLWEDLNLKRGIVSSALHATGGQRIQEELYRYYPDGIAYHTIASTEGYKLNCERVYFGVMYGWDPEKAGVHETEEMFYRASIHDFVKMCLEKAERHRYQSIAFPAIGSGNLQYPLDIVADEMFETVNQFIDDNPDSSIQHVYFVIYPDDVESVEVFQHKEMQNMKSHEDQAHRQRAAMKLTITGKKYDVEKAKGHIEGILRVAYPPTKKTTTKMEGNPRLNDEDNLPITKPDSGRVHATLATSQRGSALSDFPKEIQLPFDISIELLQFFHSDLITKHQKTGCKIEFKDTRIVLIGDKIMTTAIHTELILAVQKLKDIQSLSIDVSKIEVNEVTRLQKRYKNKQVLCTLSKSLKEMHFYGHDYGELQLEKHKMEVSLGLKSTTQRSSRHLVDDDITVSKLTNVNSNLTKEFKPKPFSWSTDAKHIEVFDTKEKLIVRVYEADILRVPVDCIVNAANKNLEHGGGVAKVISKAAGRDLDREGNDYLSKHGKLAVGEACITTAGKLPFKCVVHTVGPCWSDYKPRSKDNIDRCEVDLYNAVINALRKATERNLKTVAFPAISAAIFACPKELCCVQYAKALIDYSRCSTATRLSEVHFVDLDANIVKLVQQTFQSMITDGRIPRFYNKLAYVKTDQHARLKNKTTRKDTDDDDVAAGFGPHRPMPIPVKPHDAKDAGKDKWIYNLSNHVKLNVYTADLLKVKGIDMIVCANIPDGKSKGVLSEALRKAGGFKYTNTIDKEFKNRAVKEGDVIVCKCNVMGFNVVAHAILVKRKHVSGSEDRRQQVNSVFGKIFQEASHSQCSSIALPLLGTGKGGADPVYYTERLWESLVGFADRFKNPLEVHLVNNDPTKTATAVGVIASITDMNQKKNSTVQQTHQKPKSPKDRFSKTTHGNRNNKQPSHSFSSSVRDSKGTNATYSGGLHRTPSGSTNKHRSTLNSTKTSTKGSKAETAIDYEYSKNRDKSSTVYDITESKRSDSPPASQGSMSDDDEEEVDDCVICMDSVSDPTKLPCGHVFCRDCIDQQFKHKKSCPTCGQICGIITGDQPKGKMKVEHTRFPRCAGYEKYGRIDITYSFPDGIQERNHPSPGKRYRGFTRTAYLPDNQEGQQICAMLKVAFDRKLIFTIGSSRTTGHEGVITYNDIHQKTDPKPNTQFGYPDPTYFDRVTDELKAKGVTINDIQSSSSGRR